MKSLAIGALFLSLTAGSVAMAGQGYAGHAAQTADHDRNNPREHGDRNRRGDRGGNHNDDRWRQNHRDDHRNDGRRNDWNDGRGHDGRRGDHGRFDWNDGHRHDGRHDNWNNDHRNDGRHNNWNNDHRNDGRWDGWNHGHRNDGWRDDHRRHDWNDHRYDRPHHDWNRRGGYDYRYNYPAVPRYHVGVYHRPWGWYDHRWGRGERLPRAYYASPYVIHDYYGCGLRRPPYGYHWVRVDGDAVLAVIATGIILDVIYNQFS